METWASANSGLSCELLLDEGDEHPALYALHGPDTPCCCPDVTKDGPRDNYVENKAHYGEQNGE
jgi:hypothetical protein